MTPTAVKPELRELALTELKPAKDNLRRGLGDVAELAASIKSSGLIEPLIAVRDNGHYKVVAGHRRLAAAKKAGLKTVEVIVRELSEQDRVASMLIENLQREDLTPLEEAAAYKRLVDEHGLTQVQLAAKVGRTQGHISKRLALLELPEQVQAEVDSGGISLAAAGELSRLKDHPERLARVLDRPPWQTLEGCIDAELREVEHEKLLTAREEELESNAVATVRIKGPWNLPKNVHRLKDSGGRLRDYQALQITVKEHEQHPCHARALYINGGQVEELPVCTNRKEHPKIKTLQEKERGSAGSTNPRAVSAAQQARRQELEEAEKRRHAFIAQLLAKKQPLPRAEAMVLVAGAMLDGLYDDGSDLAAELLGLLPPEEDGKPRAYNAGENEMRTLLADEIGAFKVSVALALARAELNLDVNYGNFRDPQSLIHFELLERHGYEISPAERKELPKAKKPTLKAAA